MTVVIPRREVFTDGACSGAPGPGGWAWALASTPPGTQPWGSGSERSTTNQRMEMTAVMEALLWLQATQPWGRWRIVTDSAYVMNCFTDGWHLRWKDGKKIKDGSGVANWDIWRMLIPLVTETGTTFRKVKGHSGDPMNEYVDHLAVTAKKHAMVGA